MKASIKETVFLFQINVVFYLGRCMDFFLKYINIFFTRAFSPEKMTSTKGWGEKKTALSRSPKYMNKHHHNIKIGIKRKPKTKIEGIKCVVINRT